ncbi:hypothetical protein Nocox_24275 [Nonomuraea coxensis DSM 45129]|uniref:Uncharacterized protein n=1 Tax=Nonomuraea coxensis DSM 45129 TaxID=1122611 RepID=A0ABX8U4C3_9ACTN|nr:hypothetical protein Nocox_24275 [Nonomuraea coxensis DSM 45129]
MRDPHAGPEPLGGEARDDPGDHVVPLLPFVVLLDLVRQVRDPAGERLRQQVVGVQVAYRVEDLRQLGVEAPLGVHGRLALPAEPQRQQPQPLDGVHRVHRDLERQVHVVLLDEDQRLRDQRAPVGQGQRSCPVQEVPQLDRSGEPLVHGLGSLGHSTPVPVRGHGRSGGSPTTPSDCSEPVRTSAAWHRGRAARIGCRPRGFPSPRVLAGPRAVPGGPVSGRGPRGRRARRRRGRRRPARRAWPWSRRPPRRAAAP